MGLMTVVGVIVWAIIILVIGYEAVNGQPAVIVPIILYGLFFWFLAWVAAAFYRARAFGHFVLLSEQQCPGRSTSR